MRLRGADLLEQRIVRAARTGAPRPDTALVWLDCPTFRIDDWDLRFSHCDATLVDLVVPARSSFDEIDWSSLDHMHALIVADKLTQRVEDCAQAATFSAVQTLSSINFETGEIIEYVRGGIRV